jgi:DNA-binding GntR family transcriptional regulator
MVSGQSSVTNQSVLQHRSLPEQVHEVLRMRILNNELPAGTALIELTLADEFGVSRTTIRSALRELQAERLIEVSPRRGSTVTRMSERDIEEVCYARYVLEAAGLPETLPGLRAQITEEMQAALERMQAATAIGDAVGVVVADTELHRALIASAGHPILLDMWESLNGQMGALMRSDLDRQGIGLRETTRRHARLLEVVRQGTADEVKAELRIHYVQPAQ